MNSCIDVLANERETTRLRTLCIFAKSYFTHTPSHTHTHTQACTLPYALRLSLACIFMNTKTGRHSTSDECRHIFDRYNQLRICDIGLRRSFCFRDFLRWRGFLQACVPHSPYVPTCAGCAVQHFPCPAIRDPRVRISIHDEEPLRIMDKRKKSNRSG